MSHKSTLECRHLLGEALTYFPNFLAPKQALAHFTELQQSLIWEQSTINLYGKSHKIPRLNAWYGEPGIRYRYSGASFEAKPWTPLLLSIRDNLVREHGLSLNSVLANYYRDGKDAMGWHADNEPELGFQPVIATVSLGSARTLRFRHNKREQASFGLDLAPGSLLIMAPGLQSEWQHSLPKRVNAGPRISLTFRQVVDFRTT